MEKSSGHSHNNPIATFNRAWKIAERVFTAIALTLVAGTLGFVSVHILA